MFSNIKNIEDLIYILGVKKTKLIFLVLLILLSGFIELLGLGLIAPYVSSILKLDSFTNFNFSCHKFMTLKTNNSTMLLTKHIHWIRL